MGCINSKKDLSDIKPNVYRVVNVDANGEALWSGHLEISPKELILHRKGREPTRWSLQHLRRYGFESDTFTFEAGRRCPTGEGIFAFRCRRAENLFHVMQTYIQGIALNDDINQQLSDMSGAGINGPNSVINRFNRQSTSNVRPNSIQNHNASSLIPSNRQGIQSPSGATQFSMPNRNSDTFSNEGNYLEPTPMRNSIGGARYSSGVRLSSVGSGPISPEPNSPGSPNSFTIILEVTQLNQPNQQNYANSNIYQEFPVKPSENNNNLLNNKLSLDIPPQEPAPAIVSNKDAVITNQNPVLSDETQTPHSQANSCSPTENDESHMYVNVTPGDMESIIGNGTPTIGTTSQMNFGFPRLSSTYSMDLSTRCYENLEPGEFRAQLVKPRYSKPDIFAKVDLPPVGTRLENTEKSEPTTPVSKEESRKVNYIVLDLDNSPSTTTTSLSTVTTNVTSSGNIKTTISSTNNGTVFSSSTLISNNTICSSNSNQMKPTVSIGAGANLLPLESPKIASLGYATIDFNKTVALSNSTIPSLELDNEGSRKTRHSSTVARQSNSISD